ncbi:MAG: hypothetical protein UR78_C0010G0002 [Candidatus Moranbacteria bacterium GW2011_GWF2_35_39]|nr:MAG: hypothetical protein UR78_C0010G0002 [Candidatus Moranbacteria bacterium GW2011_GWF2_35_39]OGI31284.1 MAG: hypothetical protein A2343_02920 [Candidatus Moranbacteria bacterium RIFOXYB12_FULL_35_8]
MKTKIALAVCVAVLFFSSSFLAVKYFSAKKEIANLQQKAEKSNNSGDGKVLAFGQLFIEKVLEAQGEVEFETRLELENAVRDLNDEELLNQWKLFVASGDETSAQKEVRNLLKMLMNKIDQRN